MDNQRNLIVAVVLCLALLLGFEFAMSKFYPEPAPTEPAERIDAPTQRAAVKHTVKAGSPTPRKWPRKSAT